MLLVFFKFKNAFKSRENDPKRQYIRRPVYGYVMAKILHCDSMITRSSRGSQIFFQ